MGKYKINGKVLLGIVFILIGLSGIFFGEEDSEKDRGASIAIIFIGGILAVSSYENKSLVEADESDEEGEND
ncbi:hypothetical protein A2442_04050 [Candidatus Campbellbacteria bacterium RIFOXYC2_FULL_35_25]|uniref:Uncharacterized protein n=1 Tax=Candidatus Campbellbacteria bacterium RIFOXYC2_FULL_35_25 TaxID=1797582 RepID=A0A1F5EK01_9BACT|nr:MAG: hypothetical protein A2442_04050 [Candidatus Campbellbacteria bacterium RIFOXYC2_FULL_35_25]